MRKTFRNEADVKDAVKSIIKAHAAWYHMPVIGAYGVQGVPDFDIVMNGRSIRIETKFSKNHRPTLRQQLCLYNLTKAGALCMVINEKNIGDFALVMDMLETGRVTDATALCHANVSKYFDLLSEEFRPCGNV